MTAEQAGKLRPGDVIHAARCMHGCPIAVKKTTFKRIDPRATFVKSDAVGIEVADGGVWSSDRIHLTEEDAKADIRVILALRIEKLKAELSRWF
ncbi:MAG: hypothetical protein WKF75_00085 [Singulisphaera sp.]